MKAVLQDTYNHLYQQSSFEFTDQSLQVNEQTSSSVNNTDGLLSKGNGPTLIKQPAITGKNVESSTLRKRPPTLKNINRTTWNNSNTSSGSSSSFNQSLSFYPNVQAKKSSNNSSIDQYFDAIDRASLFDVVEPNSSRGLRKLQRQKSVENNNRIIEEGPYDCNSLLKAIDVLREKILQSNAVTQNAKVESTDLDAQPEETTKPKKSSKAKRRNTSKTLGLKDTPKFNYDDDSSFKNQKKELTVVEVRIVFLKIGEIDTLKELYHAEAFIQAKWREKLLDDKSLEELATLNLERFWSPMLYIDNILTEIKEARWMSFEKNEQGQVFIIEKHRVKGIFLETLELNDFPLDVQDLTITVTTERPDSEIDIVPDESEQSAINLQTFVDQQEWRLHEHIEISKRLITQEYSSSMRSHPCLSVTCRAARRPGYFYWNVFLIMFMISSLAFATFSVTPDKAELRLRLSFTLVLTSVTFKYVITQSLPKISYLTYMDKYVLMSLAILCIISIWHAFVTLIPYTPERPSPTANYTETSKNSRNGHETTSPSTVLNQESNQSENDTDFGSFNNNESFSLNANAEDVLDPQTRVPVIPNEKEEVAQPQNFFLIDTSKNYSQRMKNILTFFHAYIDQRLHIDHVPDNILSEEDDDDKIIFSANREECIRKMPYDHYLKLQNLETNVFITFVVIYISGHVLFIFWLYFDASKRRREMFRKDREFRMNKIPVIVVH